MKKFSLVFLSMIVLVLTFFASISSAATVGQQLTQPESGWLRYDDGNSAIVYTGTWVNNTINGAYNGKSHHTKYNVEEAIGSKMNFDFYGTKVRLIGQYWTTDSNSIDVYIDGVFDKNISQISGSTQTRQILNFEKIGLTEGRHTVEMVNRTKLYFVVDAIDIDSTGYLINPSVSAPILTAEAGDEQISLNWSIVSGATKYNVKRSTTASGSYMTTGTTYSDTAVMAGTTYYYTVTAVNANGESGPSNEVSVTLIAPTNPILDIIIDKEEIKVGEQFTSNVELKNVSNIYAEDFKINYDSSLLNYVGFEEIPGYKIYNQPTDENGKLRFIIASQGEQYGITGDKVFLKLKFSGKAKGTAKVDALECRIADTESEYDLNEDSCLEDSIEVVGPKDVNRSGEYTLVDLAIDGFYFGKTIAQTDLSKHDADQVEDGIVDDNDLVFIVNEILNNPNYTLNA